MYNRDDFYVDNEYGYFIVFGDKVFNIDEVKYIYLRGEAMYIEMSDGTKEYFDIVVNVVNIPILLDFIKEFKVAKTMSKKSKECMYERSFRYYAFYVFLVLVILFSFLFFLTK